MGVFFQMLARAHEREKLRKLFNRKLTYGLQLERDKNLLPLSRIFRSNLFTG